MLVIKATGTKKEEVLSGEEDDDVISVGELDSNVSVTPPEKPEPKVCTSSSVDQNLPNKLS